MESVVESRVIGLVEAFLDERIDMDQLEDGIHDVTWDKPDAPQVAHRVEHLIAEVRSDNDLRTALGGLMSAS